MTNYSTLMESARTALRTGQTAEAHRMFAQARELAHTDGDIAEALCGVGRALANLGHYAEGEVAIREAFQRATHIPPTLARARTAMGLVNWLRGDLKSARLYFDDAQNEFQKLGLVRDRAAALGNLALVLKGMGEYQRAIQTFKEVVSLCESLNDLSTVSINANNLGECYYDLGAFESSRESVIRALQLARLIDATALEIDPTRNLGMLTAADGQFTEALELVQRACTLAEEYQREHLSLQACISLAEIHYMRGAYADAEQVVHDLLPRLENTAVRRARARLVLGQCALARGQGTQAMLMLEQGLADAEAAFSKLLVLRYHATLGQIVEHAAIADIHRRIAAELVQQIGDTLTERPLREAFLHGPVAKMVKRS